MTAPGDPGGPPESARPTPAERLGAPAEGSRRSIAETVRDAAAGHPTRKPEKISPLKAIERFFRGLARLGPTYTRAKIGERRLDALDSQMGALLDLVQGRIDDRLAALERDLDPGGGGGTAERLARIEAALGLGDARQGRSLIERIETLEGAVFYKAENQIQVAQAAAERIAAALDEARGELARLGRELGALREAGEGQRARLARAASEAALLSRSYADLSRRLDIARFSHGTAAATPLPGATPPMSDGLDALIESFYARLEERFRGGREAIKAKLATYLPDTEAARARTGALPVLDLGCGRGEWLELLGERGIEGRGVDLNPQQLVFAREAGVDAVEGDAFEHLAAQPDGSLSVLSAHHFIEHIPFERLVWMTREALRVLAPGGILIYETPNPRNLLVGATTFRIDPTHNEPLPGELLSTLLDTLGFHPVELRPLHPYENFDEIVAVHKVHPDVAALLFGPQDLGVVAVKPASPGGPV